MVPSKHTAAIVTEGGFVELKKIDVPKPGDNEVLVKVVAASLNPTDWKSAKRCTSAGTVSGCDFAGTVEVLGPGAEAAGRTIGERVTLFVPGARSNNGSYAEYVVAKADVCMTIPSDWTFEQAAQLPIAVLTTSQCLYQTLDLPTPENPAKTPIPLLVYGASSSVGNYVVQFAKLGGMKVYGVCSPRNFDLVKGLGADEVFDYRDPDVSAKIKQASGGAIKNAVDTISELGSAKIIVEALSDEGGKIACILPYSDADNAILGDKYSATLSLAYDLIVDRPGAPSRLDLGPGYAKRITNLLAQGKLKPSPILVMPKGIASVNDGFKYMMDGKVSGQKIIFRIADTPGL